MVVVGINAKILTAKKQDNQVVVYIDTNPKEQQKTILLFPVLTGQESQGTYIDTVMLDKGTLVVHVFYK